MKKVIKTIISALLVGGIFAIIMFKNIEQGIAKTNNENTAIAFQVGVYSNYDNALKESKKYNTSIIINDNNYYRIYIDICKDEEVIKLMKDVYKDNNIYFKEINVSNTFIAKLEKYESMIKESDSSLYKNINQTILNEYKNDR